jgi:PBSX family phage portal protein
MSDQIAVASTKEAHKANQGAVRAFVVSIKKQAGGAPTDHYAGTTASGMSTAVTTDPILSMINEGKVIEPPFDMLVLSMLPEQNTEMNQCVEAMMNNIDGFGYRFVPRIRMQAAGIPEVMKAAVREEKVKLENFFMYAIIEYSFTEFRKRLRKDLETTGNAGFEVIRNAAGTIQGFTHIPSHQIRLSAVEDNPIEVKWPILELQLDNSVKITTINIWKRFRKYVQTKATQTRNLTILGGYKCRWYKEFGDPRVYDNETGELITTPEKIAAMPVTRRANELIHITLYSARTPYGLPRYIGNLLSIFGDRASEEINYTTFKNNNIPSMVVMVSNGQLTQGSIERISTFVESQIVGSDNYSKFLILEAEGVEEGEDAGQVKMEIKPLVEHQHKDALFQKYSSNNQDKVRRVWRLPPIFVGRSDDYTRATAEASRRLADEQLFAPERDDFDDMINRILFPHMGVVYHKFKSNTPNTTDNSELVSILSTSEKTGGINPKIARGILSEILGQELPDFPVDFPADVPFSLTMAEAVKNMASAVEPGQQVTALKMIKALTGDDGDLLNEDQVIDKLLAINKKIEDQWRGDVLRATSKHSADEADED